MLQILVNSMSVIKFACSRTPLVLETLVVEAKYFDLVDSRKCHTSRYFRS